MSALASSYPQGNGSQPQTTLGAQEQSDRDAKFRSYKESLRDTMVRGIIDEKQVRSPPSI
jgi:hypothetical protein